MDFVASVVPSAMRGARTPTASTCSASPNSCAGLPGQPADPRQVVLRGLVRQGVPVRGHEVEEVLERHTGRAGRVLEELELVGR